MFDSTLTKSSYIQFIYDVKENIFYTADSYDH